MPASPSPQDLLPRLFDRLETALTHEYARRYDDGVALHHDAPSPAAPSPSAPARLPFRIDYQGHPELAATLTVADEGNGTYTVRCAAEHGEARSFSYRAPQPAEGPSSDAYRPGAVDPETARLGQAMASFLLAELQKELSRLVLDGPPDSLFTAI